MTQDQSETAEKIRLFNHFVAGGVPGERALELTFEALAAERSCRSRRDAELWRKVRLAITGAQIAILSHEANEACAAEAQRRSQQKADAVEKLCALAAYATSLVGSPNPSLGDDGWSWPVLLMESGWSSGKNEDIDTGRLITTRTYVPPEFISQVAKAANGKRFRRKHPIAGDGEAEPELVCGWLEGGRVEGGAAFATAHLLRNELCLRSLLLAARDSRQLSLFGVSLQAHISNKMSRVDGELVMVAAHLDKFVALDMCAEPGAGGRFLESVPSPHAALTEVSGVAS